MNQSLYNYILRLADSSLIIGHRNSEWCGHGPILEEDIALTNISLDLVGQATTLMEKAAELEGKGRTGDDLAFLRDTVEYRNFLMVEQLNGDFGQTILRQFFYSAFTYILYNQLQQSKDDFLAAFAAKSIKEVTYHLRHSKEWVIRLGDGTEESHARMQNALSSLWMFTGDMFTSIDSDNELVSSGIAVDFSSLKPEWDKIVNEVLTQATLTVPEKVFMQSGSREGKHTEHLGFLLAEMQFLPRAYPGAKW